MVRVRVLQREKVKLRGNYNITRENFLRMIAASF